MLPSRGLVRSSQAMRLRTGTRSFGTRRSVAGASATIAQLSGRRVTLSPPSSSSSAASSPYNYNAPSTAAAFSLWPFSRKAAPAPDAAVPDAAAAALPAQPAPAPAPAPAQPPLPEPTPAAAAPPPAPEPVLSSSSSSTSSSITPPDDAAVLADLLDGSALLDMASDQLGYLHALGLDYGWGPTSMCQWAIEHVHVYSGLPWWASILATTVLFRAAIFLPSLTAAEHSAKIQLLRADPAYAQAMEDMQTAAFRGGGSGPAQMKAMEARLKLKQMQKDANVSTYKMFVPMVNVPFGYGMFRLLRGMATLPVPELEAGGGLLWFTDLTVPDPYFLLPLGSAGIMYVIFRANMRYMAPQMQSMMKIMQIVITPISVVLTARMASVLTFFFFTSSFLQMLQTALWHQPWLRRWKGLPPMEQMVAGGTLRTASSLSGSSSSGNSIPATFRLEPGSSWQAPRTVARQQQQPSSTSAAGSASAAAAAAAAEPPSAVEVVKQGWNKMMGQAQDKKNDMSAKDVFAKADLFEKKRTVEDEEGLYRRREAERQYREMKKAMAKGSAAPRN